MSLKSGTYQILSHENHKDSGKQLRLARYEGDLVLVNDSSNVTSFVEHISGDQYKIQFEGASDWFGPAKDISADDRIYRQPQEYIWSINQAGDAKTFKVHVPEKDLYWNVPEGSGNEGRVRLAKSQGNKGELWTFESR